MATTTNDGINFRLATAEDVAALERLINKAFNNDKTTDVFLSPDHEGIDVTDAAAIAAQIVRPNCAVLAATDADGTVVAHCSVRLVAGTDGKEDCAWFGLLAVDTTRQRGGLGSRVLAWAERYAVRELGVRRMEFDVVNTRAELIAWYSNRGYRPTGKTNPFPYEYHGDWQGVLRDDLHFVLFAKDLDVAAATVEVK